MRQTIVNEEMKDAQKKKTKCRCTRTNHKKKKKKQLYNAGGEGACFDIQPWMFQLCASKPESKVIWFALGRRRDVSLGEMRFRG